MVHLRQVGGKRREGQLLSPFSRKLGRAVVVVCWLQAVGRLLLGQKEILFLPGVWMLWWTTHASPPFLASWLRFDFRFLLFIFTICTFHITLMYTCRYISIKYMTHIYEVLSFVIYRYYLLLYLLLCPLLFT